MRFKFLLVLLPFVVVTHFQTSTAEAQCVTFPMTGSCYEAILAPGISWSAARDACAASGGHLVTISSAEENAFVEGLVANSASFWFVDSFGNALGPWIGSFQAPGSPEPAGAWQWVTGETWSYENWSPGQPDNAFGGQDFGHLFRPGNSPTIGWDDAELDPPGTFIKGYICETDGPVSTESARWSELKSHFE